MSEKYKLDNGVEVDGFVSSIMMPNGKVYALKCRAIEAHPIQCPNCGHSFELAFGKGHCDYCGTYFTTEFKITEVKNE